MIKSPTPTPPQSHTQSLEHAPSPKHEYNLSTGPIMPYLEQSCESKTATSDSDNIGQMFKDFIQQEIVPSTSVLDNLTSHLAGELPYEQNQLVCLSDFDQPNP